MKTVIALGMCCFIALLLSSCQWWQSNPDNLLEEVVEDVIEGRTGIRTDLSSDSEEKR